LEDLKNKNVIVNKDSKQTVTFTLHVIKVKDKKEEELEKSDTLFTYTPSTSSTESLTPGKNKVYVGDCKVSFSRGFL